MHYSYLIIGGSMTAAAAVQGIREIDTNNPIGLIGAEAQPPYKRPLLSKALWKGEPFAQVWIDIELQDVELFLGRQAQVLDAAGKQVTDDQGTVYTFDKLLLATGAPTFEQLHLLLDKHAGEQLELIDTLAERVQQLGGVAIADPRHVAELTTIERAPDGVEEVGAMLARLLSAHETIITVVREAIEQTAQNGDGGSNDLLMGEVLRTHEQQVWGVAEHLVETPLVRA